MDVSTAAQLGPHTPGDIARYYAHGDWQDEVLAQIVQRHAHERADQVFVTDGDTSFTYGELYDRAVRLATGLRGLGVERGDRVAVQLPNWAEFAVAVVAISRLGAVLVPIMPIFRFDEVSYMVRHSGAVVSISPEFFHKFDYRELYREVRTATPALRHSVIVRGERPSGDGESELDGLFAAGDVAELDGALGAPAGPDDPCLIVYTSGTTSRPKGCLHTFNTIHASAKAMIARLGIDDGDVFFNPSPVAHSTGLVTGLLMPILAGAGTHFQPAWDPEDGLRRIAEYRCTVTYTATTFISTVMQAYDADRHDMSSMRFWVCAGAPIPGAIVQAARSLFPGCSVLSLYGRSENMTTTMCGPDDPPERSVTSDGHSLPAAEVIVVDREGARVPAGGEGDVAYHGPSHMIEYYRDPEQTAELYTADGFSRSGDLGVQDEQGFVRVSGRVKDVIIRGGLNISSREVEDLLSGHPSIRAVAVVAMPDARLGERCCAFVVLAPDAEPLTLAEVNAYLQSHKIAVQKQPERLELVDELPMTAVGKIRKNVLRDQIAATLEAERNASVSP